PSHASTVMAAEPVASYDDMRPYLTPTLYEALKPQVAQLQPPSWLRTSEPNSSDGLPRSPESATSRDPLNSGALLDPSPFGASRRVASHLTGGTSPSPDLLAPSRSNSRIPIGFSNAVDQSPALPASIVARSSTGVEPPPDINTTAEALPHER